MRVRVQAENGEAIEARTEEWVAAIIVMMPPAARQALFERVQKRIIAYSTPGSYILHAEPGVLGLKQE